MDLEVAQFIATLMASITPALLVAWLTLRKQETDKPLTVAQAGAASMAALRDQFEIMKATTSDQALTIERQNTTIANLRADTAAQQLVHDQSIAKTRVEMQALIVERELASQTLIAKLQTQLTEQGIAAKDQSIKQEALLTTALAKIETLESELKGARKEIADLNKMLTESRKETAEAKVDSAEAVKPDAAAPLVPLPFPVTIVDPPPAQEGKAP